jgi:hypothetical protein
MESWSGGGVESWKVGRDGEVEGWSRGVSVCPFFKLVLAPDGAYGLKASLFIAPLG